VRLRDPISWSRRLAEEAAATAVRDLAAPATRDGLVRELAWLVVQATGAPGCPVPLEGLVALAEANLDALLEEVIVAAESAAITARASHLRQRPHDAEGAEVNAVWAATEAARQTAAAAYLGVLELLEEIVDQRLAHQHRPHRRRRERPVAATRPARVLEAFTRASERFGWPVTPGEAA